MENKDFDLSSTGINPVSTSGDEKDFYFSNVQTDSKNIEKSVSDKVSASAAVKRSPVKKGAPKSVAGTYVFFIVVIAVSMLLSIYAVMCLNDVLAITKTSSTVTVSFNESIESTNEAVDLLADNGLIKCKNFCKLFAKYRETYVGAPYVPGVYYLNGKMGLEGMLIAMQGSSDTAETVSLVFPEGFTVAEVVDRLVANEVCDKASLLSVIQSVEFSYSLVNGMQANEQVPYRLEGYLFPDTYDFYVGESATSVVKKFLANGDAKITKEHREKAKKMGYSMQEIMIIASIIQKEAGDEAQMKEISAVIHNRLSDKTNFPSLGCDSTADYITNKVGPSLSSTSAHTADYYLNYYSTDSTSTVVGLPAGPICNPGIAAINAALNPADSDAYFFFHDNKGTLYTASSYSEFKQKVASYAPYLNY